MPRVWKFGADIDTDQIVPARYAPYLRPDLELEAAAFIDARPEFARDAEPGDVLVAGHNFGCGSSREYATLALKRRRLGAVIVSSVARIFFRNAINLGIPVFVAPEIADALTDGQRVTVDLGAHRIICGETEHRLPPLSPFARKVLDAGGIVPYIRECGAFPDEDAAARD